MCSDAKIQGTRKIVKTNVIFRFAQALLVQLYYRAMRVGWPHYRIWLLWVSIHVVREQGAICQSRLRYSQIQYWYYARYDGRTT